ncbi:hypothetical protein CYMTET_36436, partial [Cymbomonas tetramitiformis]
MASYFLRQNAELIDCAHNKFCLFGVQVFEHLQNPVQSARLIHTQLLAYMFLGQAGDRSAPAVSYSQVITLSQTRFEQVCKDDRIVMFPAEAGYAQMTTLVCSWLEQATADESTNESRAFDEVHFVSELVKERFDPQRADVVFSDGASVPTWLQDIIKDKSGRTLLYELAEQHNDCLLLSCAIQSIWK